MARLENSGGDVLARGGTRANFHGPNVSQEVWDAIWEPEVSSGYAVPQATGDGGVVTATDQVCSV